MHRKIRWNGVTQGKRAKKQTEHTRTFTLRWTDTKQFTTHIKHWTLFERLLNKHGDMFTNYHENWRVQIPIECLPFVHNSTLFRLKWQFKCNAIIFHLPMFTLSGKASNVKSIQGEVAGKIGDRQKINEIYFCLNNCPANLATPYTNVFGFRLWFHYIPSGLSCPSSPKSVGNY